MSVRSAQGLKQSSNQIGQKITSYLPTTSVPIAPGNSSANLLSITLPSGVWDVLGLAWMSLNLGTDFSNGYLEIFIRDSAGTSLAVVSDADSVQNEIWTGSQNKFTQLSAVLDVDIDTTYYLYYNISYASGGVAFNQGSSGVATGLIATRIA